MAKRISAAVSLLAVMRAIHAALADTHVDLPVTEPPAESTTHYVDLPSPQVNHTFQNATNDTYVLNFTNDMANVTASFDWNATNGSAAVTLNGTNGTLFASTFNGTASHQELFENVTTGEWNLTITYTNFTGTFDFALNGTASAGSAGNGTEDGPVGTNGTDGGGDGDLAADGREGEDSPGLPVVLGLTAVALMAALRRR